MNKLISITITTVFLSACGGGGDSSPTTGTGQFKDSNVKGLSYVSGAQSGVTNEEGEFVYEVGQPVTFKIGAVTIGSADAKSLMTPTDLISGGTTDNTQVKNIVRFLMALDADGDATNGIEIVDNVINIAQSWEQIDFSVANLDGETSLTGALSDAQSVDSSGSYSLPTEADAKAHLESTLKCSHSGIYKGTYSIDGTDTALDFMLLFEPESGTISGTIFEGQNYIGLDAQTAIITTNPITATVDNDELTFSIIFDSVDKISGTWADKNLNNDGEYDSGTLTGERIGGPQDALQRFHGTLENETEVDSVYTFDTYEDASGNGYASGAVYIFSENVFESFSGEFGGSSLDVSIIDNQGTTTIAATVEDSNNDGIWDLDGTIEFNDTDKSPETINITGKGCNLN